MSDNLANNLKVELDRLQVRAERFQQHLNTLVIKARFEKEFPCGTVSFQRKGNAFRICLNDVPFGDLKATEKIAISRVLSDFEDSYTAYLNDLLRQAKEIE